MKYRRSGGILLHPTSLAGPYGIGDLGPQATHWLDFLAQSGCNLWQVLPLGSTGWGDSPYQSYSSFAGNPSLVSPDLLIEEGLLKDEDLDDIPFFPDGAVDYDVVVPWKFTLLDRAYERFKQNGKPDLVNRFNVFQQSQKSWLMDYALFMALKEAHEGALWTEWEPELRNRKSPALQDVQKRHTDKTTRYAFHQFLFFKQWEQVREYAEGLNIQIIGDLPLYAAHDSSDVWSRPDLFNLDEEGNPTTVAGVPPDYFSKTGQLWGNPIYLWDVHAAEGYAWWLRRLKATLDLVHIVRLDHFRGFAGYWEVPAAEETAENGRWAPGPGKNFFQALKKEFKRLPFIAEDLGVITKDVEELRDAFNLPGMRVLQFAFSGNPKDPFLPHNYPVTCVVYTGTHDNDTTRGWFETLPETERDFYRRYTDKDGRDAAWDLIRLAWASVAAFAIAPMQDFLNLGSGGRMNYPGSVGGNWAWRMREGELSQELAERVREVNHLYGR